jgi:hypothetical protein
MVHGGALKQLDHQRGGAVEPDRDALGAVGSVKRLGEHSGEKARRRPPSAASG